MSTPPRRGLFHDYGFVWVTLAFFLISLAGHWIFAWYAYAQEQAEHQQAIRAGDYVIETLRDTLENWQSEFLQLIWQVGGLAFLWYLGSPQSKEGDDRKEAKLDAILRVVDPEQADARIRELDEKFPRTV